jgi:hypothetical protein
MDIIYYVVQIVLFIFLAIISAAVHKVNINRYSCINKQYQEVMLKNKEINSLYLELALQNKEKVKQAEKLVIINE